MTQPPPLPPPDPADHSAPIPLPQAIKRWLPLMKMIGPPLVAAVLAIADGRHNKQEVSEKTDNAYKWLAPKTNASDERIKNIEQSISKLAETVELQGKLLLAMQPGFTTTGAPTAAAATPLTPAARRKKAKHVVQPADPALVKKVQTEGVKTLQDIKQRAAEPASAAAPLPPTIPSQPPPAPAPEQPR